MTDDIQTLRDDISYLKDLADAGEKQPISGLFGFCIGMIWTLAALGVWAEMVGLFRLPGVLHQSEFLMAMVVQAVFMLAVLPGRRQSTSRNARQFGQVWAGLGLTLGVIMLGIWLMTLRPGFHIPWVVVMLVAIGCYGGAWFACSLISEQRWMKAITAGCALGVVFLALVPQSGADYMLSYAGCLFLFGAAPGLYMMARNAKAA